MNTHDLAYTRNVLLVDYGREVEQEIVALQELIEQSAGLAEQYPSRWLAIKLLEGDADITPRIEASPRRQTDHRPASHQRSAPGKGVWR